MIMALLCLTWLTLTSEKCNQGLICKELVVVMDMTDLDGCGMILVTKENKKLLPTNIGEYLSTVKDGDQLMVSYSVIEDAMSICMTEDAMVKLNCVELVSPVADYNECPKMIDPVDFAWSKKVLGEIDLRRIELITTSEGDYYRFSANRECHLYKCTGQFICNGTCDEKDECETYFAKNNIKINRTRIIYVQDN